MNMFMDFLLATEDKKHPVSNTISMYQFPTGFMYLDYGVGSYLTVLDDAVQMVRRAEPDFDLHHIPEDDAATYEMISSGRTSAFSTARAAARSVFLRISIGSWPTQPRSFVSWRCGTSARASKRPSESQTRPFVTEVL